MRRPQRPLGVSRAGVRFTLGRVEERAFEDHAIDPGWLHDMSHHSHRVEHPVTCSDLCGHPSPGDGGLGEVPSGHTTCETNRTNRCHVPPRSLPSSLVMRNASAVLSRLFIEMRVFVSVGVKKQSWNWLLSKAGSNVWNPRVSGVFSPPYGICFLGRNTFLPTRANQL